MNHLAHLAHLARKSAWNRRSTLILIVFAVCLSTILLLGIEKVRYQVHEGFLHSVSGTDLVVGARGSPIQLMLYTVFHIGGVTNNMGWDSVKRISANPGVKWVVPVSMGDSHAGFPVLATTSDYFTHFRYRNRQELQFNAGKSFQDVFDVVLGAEVAESLNYSRGSRIVLSHGSGGEGMNEHTDKPFVVSGILARTGTPVDRTLYISLAGMEAIHLDWGAGAPIPDLRISPDMVHKFNLTPKSVTAVLLGLNSRAEVFRMQQYLADDPNEPLMGVLPGVALDELWRMLDMGGLALKAVSVLVVVMGLAGLASSILASLGERRRELAILRSVGARPSEILLLLLMEGMALVLAGMILGVITLNIGLFVFGRLTEKIGGIGLYASWPTSNEWFLLGGIFLAGVITSLIPAIRAYRMSLTDGLTANT